METPSTDTSTQEPSGNSSWATTRHIRLAVWALLVAGLLGYIAFGSVSAISYTYYAFSGRLVRLSPHRSLIDIWRDAIDGLPAFSVGWLPSATFTASLAVVVVCAIVGAWLLLVQAPAVPRRSTRAE